MPGAMRGPGGVHLDLAGDLADGGDRRAVEQRRAAPSREAEVCGVALERIGQPTLRLEHGGRAVVRAATAASGA